jgi:hypothetical protein
MNDVVGDQINYSTTSTDNWAQELGLQAMEMRTGVFGKEHHHTLTSMANLAFTYSNQDR